MLIMMFCSVAHASQNKKYDFLLRFFDFNEAAFAYHRHCLSVSDAINPKFLRTLELVADALFDEMQKEHPRMKPEYIKAKILERRYNIQYKLDHANIK